MSADEIAFLEGMTIVYKNSIDLFFYVVGSAQENEVLSFLFFYWHTYRYSHIDFTFYFILCKTSKAMTLSHDFSLFNFLMDLFFFVNPIFSWCWCQYWTACLSLSVRSSGESSFMSRNNFRNVLISFGVLRCFFVCAIGISSILWSSGQIQLCVSPPVP